MESEAGSRKRWYWVEVIPGVDVLRIIVPLNSRPRDRKDEINSPHDSMRRSNAKTLVFILPEWLLMMFIVNTLTPADKKCKKIAGFI